MTVSKGQADIIIVGGGLAGLMAAWRALDRNPELTALLIEASAAIAGDHTWSFNLSDIREDMQDWIKPFIAHQWNSYDVKFPKYQRELDIIYCSGNSDSLRRAVSPLIESGRLKQLNTPVETLNATSVTLPDGKVLTAKCVCDARGFNPNENVVLGYQKFVGHTIKTKTPHGMMRPIIMDATVEQLGGYRFVYCLPFSETEMLVEDTYYTDGPNLSENEINGRIVDYIARNLGLTDYAVSRREKGVLPITLAVDPAYGEAIDETLQGPVLLGMRGGYYHAVTGYSILEAAKSGEVVADMIAKNSPDFGEAVRREMTEHKRDHYHEENFLRLLNRMLFRAAKPEQRYKVLQRFYRLSEGLVARFYRNRLTKADKIRILFGKPPVPISKALANFSESKFIERELPRK